MPELILLNFSQRPIKPDLLIPTHSYCESIHVQFFLLICTCRLSRFVPHLSAPLIHSMLFSQSKHTLSHCIEMSSLFPCLPSLNKFLLYSRMRTTLPNLKWKLQRARVIKLPVQLNVVILLAVAYQYKNTVIILFFFFCVLP